LSTGKFAEGSFPSARSKKIDAVQKWPPLSFGNGGFTANGYSDSTQQPQNLSLGIRFYGEFMATFFGRFNLTLPGSEGMGSGEAEWHPFLIYLSFGP